MTGKEAMIGKEAMASGRDCRAALAMTGRKRLAMMGEEVMMGKKVMMGREAAASPR